MDKNLKKRIMIFTDEIFYAGRTKQQNLTKIVDLCDILKELCLEILSKKDE